MTSQTRKQTIAIQLLPSISRGKENQTMKYGQLIECNVKNVFPESSYTKYGRETISRPYSKKLKLNISLHKCLMFYASNFIVCQIEDYPNNLELSFRSLAIAHIKLFKHKKRS